MGAVKIVRASAGSGKTYNLAYEYVRNVIADPERYRHILAVTFTNKATEEMKQRILKQINLLAEGRNEDIERRLLADLEELAIGVEEIRRRAAVVRNHILHDYSNFYILTIDKFFQRIIRAFIRELGIDMNFNLELQTDSILDTAADKLIDDLSDNVALRKWVLEYIGENISENNRWNIKDGLVKLGKEIFKENTIFGMEVDDFKERLKAIVAEYKTKSEVAVAKRIESANLFMKHIADNGLDVKDFHYGRNGVAGFVERVAAGGVPDVGNRVNAAREDGVWCSAKSPKRNEIEAMSGRLCKMLNGVIDELQHSCVAENNYSLLKKHYRNFALMMDLQRNKDLICAQERILPISDINKIIADLVSGNDAPFIFEKTGTRFAHFMIDEFQDTSAMQWNNFLPLLRNAEAQTETDAVMLVGDVKQSIYRWRGGDWTLLSEKAETEFRSPNIHFLQNNYRSSKDVVEFNNALIGACVSHLNDSMNDIIDGAFETSHISGGMRSDYHDMIARAYEDWCQTPVSEERGFVSVSAYEEYDEEAEDPIVTTVLDLLDRGYRPCDIAILVRSNWNARNVADLLLDYKQRKGDEVNFNIVTHEALTIGNSALCSFVISCMGLAVNPEDVLSRAVYNRWRGAEFETAVSDEEASFFRHLSMKSPQEAFEEIVVRYDLGAHDTEVAYLQALHDKVIDFCRSKVADLGMFLEWWNSECMNISIDMPRSDDAITIATIHKAKGLEYKTVILPYCNWSLKTKSDSIVWARPQEELGGITTFPIGFKDSMAKSLFSESFHEENLLAYIDNLNILYVAVTRAVKELHIIIPPQGKRGANNVGAVIKTVMCPEGESVRVGDFVGWSEPVDGGERFCFGERGVVEATMEKDDILKVDFATRLPEERVAIKYATERYADYAVGEKQHMRDYGVLMHKVFETSSTKADIERAVAKLRNDGTINSQEADMLMQNIEHAFENPLVAGWFSGEWNEVRTEADILMPDGKVYRPDRVMIASDRTEIVDYKFGLMDDKNYLHQMRRYIEILSGMGYSSVKGYLWYISKDTVVEV